MDDYDLICLGSGPAGEKAATQAAYYRKRVAIIEREMTPGGAMVNTGTVASKALRETALLCSAFQRDPMPGMSLHFDRTMSMAGFMAPRLLVSQQEHDRIEQSMDRHGIDVYRGHGELIDANTISIERPDGTKQTLRAENILIATGSSPVRPDHIPFNDKTVVDATSLLDLTSIPDSLIVVGGGVIGSEYASTFAEIGVNVHFIHPRDAILGFVDDEARAIVESTLRDRGVHMHMSCSVKSATLDDQEKPIVQLDNGEELRADALLWAAGRSPNTDHIGLQRAGVETNDRGCIVVDDHYRTSVESIYAAGDVIGFPALASTSMEQGRIASCHMFGIEFKDQIANNMPMGLYTIPAIGMVGLSESEAKDKGHQTVVGKARYRHNVRGRMLNASSGFCKCIFDRTSRKLLGCTVVGRDAVELVHLAQSVMTQDDGIGYFINACFNYPSLTELFKYAAYDALQSIASLDEADDQELGYRAKVA